MLLFLKLDPCRCIIWPNIFAIQLNCILDLESPHFEQHVYVIEVWIERG